MGPQDRRDKTATGHFMSPHPVEEGDPDRVFPEPSASSRRQPGQAHSLSGWDGVPPTVPAEPRTTSQGPGQVLQQQVPVSGDRLPSPFLPPLLEPASAHRPLPAARSRGGGVGHGLSCCLLPAQSMRGDPTPPAACALSSSSHPGPPSAGGTASDTPSEFLDAQVHG